MRHGAREERERPSCPKVSSPQAHTASRSKSTVGAGALACAIAASKVNSDELAAMSLGCQMRAELGGVNNLTSPPLQDSPTVCMLTDQATTTLSAETLPPFRLFANPVLELAFVARLERGDLLLQPLDGGAVVDGGVWGDLARAAKVRHLTVHQDGALEGDRGEAWRGWR